MMSPEHNAPIKSPDTLMQDRLPPSRRILLLRTAGPYIGSEADFAARKARHFSGYAGIQKAQPHGMSAVAKFLIHLNFDPVPSE
jgi:hypothetical protein